MNDVVNADAVKQGFTLTQARAQPAAPVQPAPAPPAPTPVLSSPGFWALAVAAFLWYRNK